MTNEERFARRFNRFYAREAARQSHVIGSHGGLCGACQCQHGMFWHLCQFCAGSR